jgi:hypothetical protein
VAANIPQMASPLCGKPAGRKPRVLSLMIEIFFKHSLTEPGTLVNVSIETRLKAGRSRNKNSVTVWRKRFVSAFSLLGYNTTSID